MGANRQDSEDLWICPLDPNPFRLLVFFTHFAGLVIRNLACLEIRRRLKENPREQIAKKGKRAQAERREKSGPSGKAKKIPPRPKIGLLGFFQLFALRDRHFHWELLRVDSSFS